MNTHIARPGARGQEAFFCVAYELLAERGCTGLTIATMCDRLGVTKGSFYHHFAGMPAFVAAFAARWQRYFSEFFDNLARVPDPCRRMEACANSASVTMSSGVRSVLAWARTDAAVAEAAVAVYRSLWALSAGSFTDWAQNEDTGMVLGPMANAAAIGMQSRPRDVSRERWARSCAELYRALGAAGGVMQVAGRPYLRIDSWRRTDSVATTPHDVALAKTTDARPPHDAWQRMSAWPGARNRYFGAAGQLLGEHGADGLTVAALVERLELTKGSFSHHFGALPGFVEELAGAWAQAESEHLEHVLVERSPWRRLELLHAHLLIGPTAADFAWRAWAQSNEVVAAAVRGVDESRERALALTLAQIRGTTDERLLAEMTYCMSLGLHAWQPPLDRSLIARAAIEWMRRLVGAQAEISTASGVPMLALRAA